jgi:hypothetical protein
MKNRIAQGGFKMELEYIEGVIDKLECDIAYLEQRCCDTCRYVYDKNKGMCCCNNTDSFFWKAQLPISTLCEHYKKAY